MKRSRVLIVLLIACVCTLGFEVPVHAGPRFPETISKTFELARGLKIAPSKATGVYVERGARTLPIRGNLVALSLRSTPGAGEAVEELVTIEARFHTRRGWTAWETFGVEPDEGPDLTSAEGRRASKRVFTSPIWVGTADKMAFRVTAQAGAPSLWDVRAHVINSLGDARAPNLFQRVARVVSAVSRFLRGSQAQAMTSQPGIISRAGWGADERWRECCPRYAANLEMAHVHHTAGSNSYSRSESAALVRGIYKYHTSNEGFADIGYNFLIDRYGQIFEGRAGGIAEAVIGAHAGGFNTGSTGVSLMGTFTSATPPTAMINSLKRLLAWKLDVHHVPPIGSVVMTSAGSTRYPAGRRVTLNRISGHRDTSQTSCPGSKVYYQLDSIRSAVRSLGLPKIYLPTRSGGFVRPNGDTKNETVAIKATFSQSLRWVLDVKTLEGMLLRRYTGSGSSMNVAWDGKTSTGELPGSGVVRYVLSADTGSVSARGATATMYLASTHPDGTVLASPTRTVFLSGGLARPIPSTLVRNSWFRANEVVAATEKDIDRYKAGPALAMREGTLLAEPGGAYSVISGGVRRPFASGVYGALGYGASAALAITAGELATLTTGAPWTDSTRHPPGAVVRVSDGSEWTIGVADRRRNVSDLMWRTRYRDAEVVAATAGDLALPAGSPMTYRDGSLFVTPDGSHWIYAAGVKRRFYDASLYGAMGYATAAALAISNAEAGTIRSGQAIAEPNLTPTPPRWARGDDWPSHTGGGGR